MSDIPRETLTEKWQFWVLWRPSQLKLVKAYIARAKGAGRSQSRIVRDAVLEYVERDGAGLN
jgi:hypothetical protein